jgi:uncharacterized membrane protein
MSRASHPLRWSVLFAVAGLALGACGGSKDLPACPQGSTLTAQNFGITYMNTYCTRCHSVQRTGGGRANAPKDVNYDTLDEIRADAKRIHEQAGVNADDSVNTDMPPSAPVPTEAERRQLSEWLACGAP